MRITIDQELKARCPGTALASVTSQVSAGAASEAFLD
jgi:hypothetical protein